MTTPPPTAVAGLLAGLLTATVPGSFAADDPRVAWLREQAAVLRPAEAHADDLEDLEPLRASFAGTDVVLLGEATRGDGSTFAAKARLVRFLHEAMGFDVLAFECGVFDCDRAWRQIRGGRPARQALGEALFAVYAEAEPLRPLFALLDRRAATDRPLEVAGFDSQLAPRGIEALLAALDAEVARRASDREVLGGDEAWAVLRHVAAGDYTTGGRPLPDPGVRRRVDQTLSDLAAILASETPGPPAVGGGADPGFWGVVVENLRAAAGHAWELGVWDRSRVMEPRLHNLRDARMAENLLWLLDRRYPGRKVVVWSLTLHLARDLGRLETGEVDTRERFARFDLLGERLAAALEPDPYVVAFTAFDGQKGSIFQAPHDLLAPTPGSFEELMGRTGLAAAFVDLSRLAARDGGHWLEGPLIARPIAFKELRGVWSRHVDAFYFVRTMRPVRRMPDD